VAADGTQERTINLRVCEPLLAALKRCGQDAWFDPSITFVDRVARANSDGTALLVACAHDVSTPGQTGGCAVFCPGGQTFGRQEQAAGAIFAALLADGLTSQRRADVVESIYECCAFNGDTAYIELNCMSPDDEPRWSAPDYGARAAEAITRALAGVYGFAYVPAQPAPAPPPQPAPWAPEPTQAAAHWWGPYVDLGGQNATQVVELPSICHAPVWEAGGTWYRGNTPVQPDVQGEYAEWMLANLIGGVWYVMDQSASGSGPQGASPGGRAGDPHQAWWVEDADTDSSGCGGTNPPAVARARGGKWYSL
jgi:hypothetical protein